MIGHYHEVVQKIEAFATVVSQRFEENQSFHLVNEELPALPRLGRNEVSAGCANAMFGTGHSLRG